MNICDLAGLYLSSVQYMVSDVYEYRFRYLRYVCINSAADAAYFYCMRTQLAEFSDGVIPYGLF